MKKITLLLAGLFAIVYSMAWADTSELVAIPGKQSVLFPLNHTSESTFSLAVRIPRKFKMLNESEKGYIPGILTFLVEGHDEQTNNYIFNRGFIRKYPQIIRVQYTPSEISADEFINTIKAKMKKDLLSPPEVLEEHIYVSKDYTEHCLGLILGYSGQAAVEVVYLRYYSGKNNLCGIQVQRTLAPDSNGMPAPLAKAKRELVMLEKFVDKISVVRKREINHK